MITKPRLSLEAGRLLHGIAAYVKEYPVVREMLPHAASDFLDGRFARHERGPIRELIAAGIIEEIRGSDLDYPKYVTWHLTDYGCEIVAPAE